MTDAEHLVELGAEESWELAAQQQLSRIAWTSGSGPVVIPVNHVIHDRALWIRTSAYSKLVQEVDDARVAVLIDDIDAASRLGWSVLVRGLAQVHYHSEEVPTAVRELHAWAGGARPLWVEVRAGEITGRRLVDEA